MVPACGGGDGECSTSIQWTEARDAANIPQYSGPLRTAENYLIPNVNRAEIEKPSLIPTRELLTCRFAQTPTWLSSRLIGGQDPASHVFRESRAARSHHQVSVSITGKSRIFVFLERWWFTFTTGAFHKIHERVGPVPMGLQCLQIIEIGLSTLLLNDSNAIGNRTVCSGVHEPMELSPSPGSSTSIFLSREVEYIFPILSTEGRN